MVASSLWSVGEGVEDRDAGGVEVAGVAGDDGEAVVEGGGNHGGKA